MKHGEVILGNAASTVLTVESVGIMVKITSDGAYQDPLVLTVEEAVSLNDAIREAVARAKANKFVKTRRQG